MKTLKYLFLLIIILLIAGLVYLNLDYFMATVSFKIDVKDFHYAIPELQNGAYWAICFLLGLFLAGANGLATKFRLNKIIKEKEAAIEDLSRQVTDLGTELDVFKHDPYIKKGLESKALESQPLITEATETEDAATPEKEAPAETQEAVQESDDPQTEDETQDQEETTADPIEADDSNDEKPVVS